MIPEQEFSKLLAEAKREPHDHSDVLWFTLGIGRGVFLPTYVGTDERMARAGYIKSFSNLHLTRSLKIECVRKPKTFLLGCKDSEEGWSIRCEWKCISLRRFNRTGLITEIDHGDAMLIGKGLCAAADYVRRSSYQKPRGRKR